MRVPLSILNAIILLRAQVVSGVPTTKTAVRDVLCVITGKALPMCSSAEDDAEATSEDAETSSLQGADQRECRHNEASASRALHQHCRKWPFLGGGCEPRASIYSNVDIML